MTPKQEAMADKVAKLLRKAESTTPEEAESLVAKAQQLMEEYAINEALLARANGEVRKEKEEIVKVTLTYTGSYQKFYRQIGWAVAQTSGCHLLISEMESRAGYTRFDGTKVPARKAECYTTIIGFESDVKRAQMLDTSIQIQAARAMTANWDSGVESWMTSWEAYKVRRDFLLGFAEGLGAKLRAANRAAKQAVIVGMKEDEEKATESVELAIRSRKEQVQDWMDEHYGALRPSRGGYYDSSGTSARSRGYDAGQRANTNDPGLGGGRKAIGG